MEQTNTSELRKEFLTDERKKRFGISAEFSVFNLEQGEVYYGFQLNKESLEDFQLCFHMFLQEKGFTPDKINPVLGSEFNEKRLTHWLRYNSEAGDLWVNYLAYLEQNSCAEYPLDIAMTICPRKINPVKRNYAFAEAFERVGLI